MKKIALLSLLLSFFLTGLDSEKLVRFTVINKSGVEIAIRLINPEKELNYYLTIPAGNRECPTEKEFTIVQAVYTMQVLYVELYDPVYGYPECGGAVIPASLVAIRNTRLTFFECFQVPPGKGEPSWRPFWNWKPWKFKYPIIR